MRMGTSKRMHQGLRLAKYLVRLGCSLACFELHCKRNSRLIEPKLSCADLILASLWVPASSLDVETRLALVIVRSSHVRNLY